jgi:hypothetical protein
MSKLAWFAIVALATGSCDDEPSMSSKTSAVETPSDEQVITEPVPPEGFEGDPDESLPVSPEEEAAIEAARALDQARNHDGQHPMDRGFATMCPACAPKPTPEAELP